MLRAEPDRKALDTPAVLVDLDVLERNIQRMAQFAREHRVALRPHAKSHKTVGIARRQADAGAAGLTVAKLDEAEAFVEVGFSRPVDCQRGRRPDEWRRLAALQHQAQVAVGIDSLPGAQRHSRRRTRRWRAGARVLIEVDSGLGRAGVQPGEPGFQLAREVSQLGWTGVARRVYARRACVCRFEIQHRFKKSGQTGRTGAG